MVKRYIQPVTDNYDKKKTYQENFKKCELAIKNEFYFEAMLIIYAVIEDRLRSWIYYIGGLKTKSSYKLDFDKWKKEIKPLFKKSNSDKFRFPNINNISGKQQIIEATLNWAKKDYPDSNKSKYLTALKKCYQDKLDHVEISEQLVVLEKWCAYRNEIIHALMNKNLDSLKSELAEKVSQGLDLARYFDKIVKRIKSVKRMRKILGLQE